MLWLVRFIDFCWKPNHIIPYLFIFAINVLSVLRKIRFVNMLFDCRINGWFACHPSTHVAQTFWHGCPSPSCLSMKVCEWHHQRHRDQHDLVGCLACAEWWLLINIYIYTGWWFGTFFIFPYIGNNHPNWLIFFRGLKPPTRYILMYISSTS